MGPKKIVRAFDASAYYRSQQLMLRGGLPDMFVTREFRRFLAKNDERMPLTLARPFVASS
jgi:hypothetical protein